MGRDPVDDHAFLDVIAIGQAEVFLRRHITEHRRSVPTDHCRADAAGDVVVAGGNIGGQRAERVKWRVVAPLDLLFHIFLNHMHRHVAGALVHHLHAVLPRTRGEVALHF